MGFRIYVKERAILNKLIEEAHEQPKVAEMDEGYDRVSQAREWMCANFWDIRTFGALMTSGKKTSKPCRPKFAQAVKCALGFV